jgi:ribonuclease HII
MGLIIGVDEAGYGPNLGPLVITATVWEVPGDPATFDFWGTLKSVICRRAPRHAAALNGDSTSAAAVAVRRRVSRLHVADSKQVYSPARGLAPLETSVLALLGLQESHSTLGDLWRRLCDPAPDNECTEPWFRRDGLALPLPNLADEREIARFVDRVQRSFEKTGIRLRLVASDIVLTERFNGLTISLGNKASALSRTSLDLLRRAWCPERDGPALVVADKHGGRAYYQALLADVFGILPLCLNEGLECSRYRLGNSELRFEARAERYLPVAVASMVSKYVRELSMEAFNRFWKQHVPDIEPTKGYPGDAWRFRRQIAEAQQRLGIPDVVLWRAR